MRLVHALVVTSAIGCAAAKNEDVTLCYGVNHTVYDPANPAPHVAPGRLDCGGVTRAVFCCNARP